MKEPKHLLQFLGFTPKEGSSGVLHKTYSGGYIIRVDMEQKRIDYGKSIHAESEATSNFAQAENWVVLECVHRLLEKGYKPEDITLEKTWKLGHQEKGRADIVVEKEGKAFLMIECKTWGKEFEKEYKNLQKDGGQLFSYFQQDTNADFLMLYASHLQNDTVEYQNEIVQVEEHYRDAGNVVDFYNRWNKITNQNGIFESWVPAYHFENKALIKQDLKELTDRDSDIIFNRFDSILRKHSVSDSPNAFNKIFNLFLAKLYDEKKKESDELEFQWLENRDDHVEFQVRLINLYQAGMKAFLDKEVEGIKDSDFRYETLEELKEKKKKMLMFQNVFAIKEVFDKETFEDNAKVLKEVVQLLTPYQIRYPRRQQHLSNFFERLLTTGLKQRAGQFFTPPPIARFMIKSLPIKKTIEKTLSENEVPCLPSMIDYAAGSGHFLTETMEEMQNIVDRLDTSDFYPDVANQVEVWKIRKYDWAAKYIYGIEKDYRLVKVAKVGCYFYGDGLAQVIYGDGLDHFSHSQSYRGLLKQKECDSEHPVFDFVISNPPYSVDNFKGDIKNRNPKESFTLYPHFTDNSSEIEVLFVERTAQLLKEGGIAAIILPSSILSGGGFYARTRELLLRHFELVAITELGSNTFMMTGTKTVILYLRKRQKDPTTGQTDAEKIEAGIENAMQNLQDITIGGIEHAVSRYVAHVWEGLSFADYTTLLKNSPNEVVQAHELFREYEKKIKAKDEIKKWQEIVKLEKQKMLAFLLAYGQHVVLVKTGEKEAEKRFLGYEFSNRRKKEGIHPIQGGKTIDECTALYDLSDPHNPEKASSYILNAFEGKPIGDIAENLKQNVFQVPLVDMMNFDRAEFDRHINLSVKKKIRYEEIWKTENLVSLGEISEIQKGTSITSAKIKEGNIPVVAGGQNPAYFHNEANREGNIITISASGAYSGFVNYFSEPIFASDCNTVRSKDEERILTKLIFEFLKSIQQEIYGLQRGQAQPHVYASDLENVKIPLPPKDIQQKIVDEITILEKREGEMRGEVERMKGEIKNIYELSKQNFPSSVLSKEINIIGGGTPKTTMPEYWNGDIPWLSVVDFRGEKRYVSQAEKKITELGLAKSSTKMLDPGDIIISARGTVGEIAQIKVPMAFNQSCYGIKTKENIISDYLYFSLKFETEQFRNNSYGAIFDTITTKTFDSIKIPLPPLSEQQRIVAEIETIEAKIEALEKELAEIPQKKEEILKKYL